MNASSSDPARGVSSCSTTDAAAAISPIRAAGIPVTVSAAAPPSGCSAASVTLPPAAVIAWASRAGSGVRTSTDCTVLLATNSCVLQAAMSLPRPITIR